MMKATLALFAGACLLASSAIAQQAAPAVGGAPVAARPGPAPLQTPMPHYVSIPLQIDVNAPVDKVWARVGKYCDLGEWGLPECKILSGDGGFGTVRSVVREILVGKTQYSYTYTQPVREGVKYNLYHGTLEARALTPTTTRLFYTMLYDDSLLADNAARAAEIASRRKRFNGWLANMKTLAEGGKLAPGAVVAIPLPADTPLMVPNPNYVSIPMTIEVNAPVDKVWARVGKYCDIGEWGIPGCTILSGDGDFGTVRSIGNEILVGKTQYSYTYTQPVRVGPAYNMYHGTLEARPLTATTTQLNYTLFFDNSMLADEAAREADLKNRRTRFTKMLDNMKILSEGGTLPPGAVPAPRPAGAAPAAPPR
ncbi:SRPBCC family protein [Terriglobus roseus]|uniref:Polyketide cyclase / dehydrase and lipid transport n=1 Tax=Terriglobus roseus TaxID=392734 RepID=A0A1H4KMG6_9BACT|nr:SRPBCC family protein [Terriglobus roseus]SEB59446.1 Polyketide cyclase / dehydrase and lipid transport [Terriglobus roseus]